MFISNNKLYVILFRRRKWQHCSFFRTLFIRNYIVGKKYKYVHIVSWYCSDIKCAGRIFTLIKYVKKNIIKKFRYFVFITPHCIAIFKNILLCTLYTLYLPIHVLFYFKLTISILSSKLSVSTYTLCKYVYNVFIIAFLHVPTHSRCIFYVKQSPNSAFWFCKIFIQRT